MQMPATAASPMCFGKMFGQSFLQWKGLITAKIREGFKNPSNGNFPLRGGGEPPFSVNFFPLTFRENVVRDGPGGGGTPLTDNFRDWGF